MKKLLTLLCLLASYSVSFCSSVPSRLWATYFGSDNADRGVAAATDAAGNVYLLGNTRSTTGIATPGCFQSALGGMYDVFLAKFSSSGTLVWATYFGGAADDNGCAIALDAAGNIYITGFTSSTSGIATSGAYQTSFGGVSDGFIAKFNGAGSLVWATYYGGSNYDGLQTISIKSTGEIYLGGYTASTTGIASSGAF